MVEKSLRKDSRYHISLNTLNSLTSEFEIWTQFFASEGTRALQLDALESSHPIEVPCGHPSEIEEIFDAISYAKGACIIHMLHSYIGTEFLRAGT